MKMYDKKILLKRIAMFFEYYNSSNKEEEKQFLDFVKVIISKFKENDKISISKDEIEKYLFIILDNKYKKINEKVFRLLSSIGADMNGVSFENTKITGFKFNKLENVNIDLDKLFDKDLTGVMFKNVNLSGTLDNAKLKFTDFTGHKGSIKLNPQTIVDKSLRYLVLSDLVIDGSFDGVDIYGTDFKGIKGNAYINPQTIKDKTMDGVNLDGVTLVGEYYPEKGIYGSANFDGCYIDRTKFRGAKGYISINLNTLRDDHILSGVNGKLSCCDLTGVKLVGTIYCYTGKRDITSSSISDVKNDLWGSVYYNEKGECIHIYPYRSLMKKDGEVIPIDRSTEDNLDVNVVYVDDNKNNDTTNKKSSFKKKILNALKFK